MPTGQYRWVLVAAGGLMGCVAIGAMFSLPVFLQAMAQSTGWSRAGISSAMTIGFLAMGLASFGWGTLVDRFGPRPIVLCGTLLIAASLAVASRAATLLEFQIAFGAGLGIGAGAVFAPMITAVIGWFDTRRSLAVSLVSAGMGMAPMIMSPFAAWLISFCDWRTAMLTIAGVALALMLPAALLVRTPPRESMPQAVVGAPILHSDAGKALASPQFLVLALANFFCCATHSGPIFHTISYAMTCGIPAALAVSIYSVEGLAGMGGRLLFGVLGDRYGAKRAVVGGLFVQAFAAGAYVLAHQLDQFYLVGIVFGLAYAGVMPLYSVIARENFSGGVMGTIIGGLAMAGSLGMALGPLAGGWIYDAYGDYRWLYLGSVATGLAAALIAMAFTPVAKRLATALA